MNTKKALFKVTLFLIASYIVFTTLVNAQNFFAPLLTGVILVLVILPFVQFLERKNWSKSLASLTGTLVVHIASLGIVFLFSLQVKKFVSDWSTIKEEMKPKIAQQVIAYKAGKAT